MSDTAVEFPLNMLNKLLIYHSSLIGDAEKQMKSLQRDLRFFKAFLKAAVSKRRKSPLKELAENIHDVSYEVGDVIDVFVSQATGEKATSLLPRFSKSKIDLHNICRKVKKVREGAERYWIHMGILGIDDKDQNRKARPLRHEDVVGFNDVMEELIQRLTQETDYFDVVSLIGMFGMGKTTLAWKIFNSDVIAFEFPVRIWLPISDEFSDKDIFLSILKKFIPTNKYIHKKDVLEIAQIVADYLGREKFLMVLDDVSNPTDWDRLRVAIPKGNKMGKILITSRNVKVGNYCSSPRLPMLLRFFSYEESWELLRLEALHKLDCPPELENVGRQIARYCDGLPLAIVVIGGILAATFSDSDISATIKAWENVSTRVSAYIIENDPADIHKTYEKLPNHLQSCFLYFGMFPQDYEIPVSKLILMWIGEGFVQEKLDCTLEETAHMYLEELINRNLVMVDKLKPNGEVKSCRFHDALREFCLTQSANENFLHEIKNGGTSYISTYRRVCIHSNCFPFISSKPFGPCVRSVVSFAMDEFHVPLANGSIIGAFKLLRVLDVFPFRFTKIDSDLYNLVHMRYIALSCSLSILPSKFEKLWNIQTLVIHTTSRALQVQADIWMMKHLRHFKTNAAATLCKPSTGSKHGSELQTLRTISVESCTAELCNRAPNLKKMGIRGRLAMLFDRRIGSFDSLGNMEHLGKLKLINDEYPKPRTEGALDCLPRHDLFPAGLTSLTLCATFLSWDHMSTLGLLKKLEVLKLKDEAFMGDNWQVESGGFHSLEFLYIERTDLAIWKASHALNYPKLRSLVLKNCEKLRGIPVELAGIPSFRMLDLYRCRDAAKSAREISNAKRKTQAEGSAFKLFIFPPIE